MPEVDPALPVPLEFWSKLDVDPLELCPFEFCPEPDAEFWLCPVPEGEPLKLCSVPEVDPVLPVPLEFWSKPDVDPLEPCPFEFCSEPDAEFWLCPVPEGEPLELCSVPEVVPALLLLFEFWSEPDVDVLSPCRSPPEFIFGSPKIDMGVPTIVGPIPFSAAKPV